LADTRCYSKRDNVCAARLATWHLPGGPVGPSARWAATSNVEGGVQRGREPLANEEGLYLDKLFAVPRLPSNATADGADLLN